MEYKIKHVKFYPNGSANFFFTNNPYSYSSIDKTDFISKESNNFISKKVINNKYLLFLKKNRKNVS